MTKQEYIEQWTAEARRRFAEHRANRVVHNNAELHNEGSCIVINWQKPGTWNYAARFIIHRQWLCVVGDIGEATFQWSEDITLDFLAGIDFGYFMSKCRASDSGRKFEQWDNQVAAHYRKERIDEILGLIATNDESESDKSELQILQDNEPISKDEWSNVAREYYEETGDAEGASNISGWGEVPDVQAISMFVGLQMAIKQLKAA